MRQRIQHSSTPIPPWQLALWPSPSAPASSRGAPPSSESPRDPNSEETHASSEKQAPTPFCVGSRRCNACNLLMNGGLSTCLPRCSRSITNESASAQRNFGGSAQYHNAVAESVAFRAVFLCALRHCRPLDLMKNIKPLQYLRSVNMNV
ncbi:hypothetical protein GUJ93_ZPchr0002g26244 [Zizania palustris]|uniref:Uncharacterized protein n=1 Tax=Zizania palustris TaxID=103762 RepID=A0A8J5V3T8_ZIZPA|nr:hypothetical protein GUJ93_ZPchr0002g26244 [Zizania palustris]